MPHFSFLKELPVIIIKLPVGKWIQRMVVIVFEEPPHRILLKIPFLIL